MYFNAILLVATILILIGLVRSTENVLDIRQRRRDQGNDTKIYL